MRILEFLSELIFPKQCLVCGKIGNYICEKCENNIKKYEINLQKEEKFFVYKYEGDLRKLIIDYKFNEKSYLYKLFSEELLNNKKLCKFLNNYDIIIPVPVHRKRKNERGYNQTELVAREIVKNTNLTILKNVLIKEKNIKPLSSMNAKERKQNIKGTFKVIENSNIKNKKVLIFDDIYTTGSTTKEATRVLREAGVSKVGILTIARDTYTKERNK